MAERILRIGFLTPEYPTEGYSGGIGSYVRQIAHSLASLGHSVVVLLSVPFGEGSTWDGPIAIHRVGLAGVASLLPEPLGKRSGVFFALRLAGIAEKLELDVLEAPEFCGLTAFLSLLKPARLRVVVRLHTCSRICRSLNKHRATSIRGHLRNHLQDWLEARAIETADCVTAISMTTVDLTRKMLRVRRSDFQVTPNPINDLFFSPPKVPVLSGDPVVLFVGRLEWRKGPDLLIRAIPSLLERHPRVRFCFAGGDTNTGSDGSSMLAHLRSLLPEGARANVEFTGFLERGPTRNPNRVQQRVVEVEEGQRGHAGGSPSRCSRLRNSGNVIGRWVSSE